MQRPASPRINPTVFWVAVVLSALFVAWGVFFAESLAAVFDAALFDFLVPSFGLGAVRGNVHSPHLPGPDHPGVCRRGYPGPQRGQLRVVLRPLSLRRQRASRGWSAGLGPRTGTSLLKKQARGIPSR